MVKKKKPTRINEARREFDKKRRRVIYFPTPAMNEEFERVALEEGFVTRHVGQDEEVANTSAFAVWLFRQFEKGRVKKVA